MDYISTACQPPLHRRHGAETGAETGTQLESKTNEAPLQTDEPCYNRRRT